MTEAAKAKAEEVGLDWGKVKQGLARLLTIAGPLARLTPNPYDDMAVAFLKAMLAEGDEPK